LRASGLSTNVASAAQLLRRAQQKHPADFWVNHNLGLALRKVTPPERDEAVRFLTTAVALRPHSAGAHSSLGIALHDRGQVDEAIASFRKVVELAPKDAHTYYNLGNLLRKKGQLDEALAAYQRGHELGSKRPGWRYPSAQWVRQALGLAALEAKLPAFLQGELKSKDTTERLGLVVVCRAKKLQRGREVA
jgi:tetratricopeptide (TPR) repeat protein